MKMKKEQYKDTSIVIGLIFLYTGIISENVIWTKTALIILIISILIPKLFYYPAILWFGISDKLGLYISRIVLGCIYLLVVLPVGLLRRTSKKDTMLLKAFKDPGITSSWTVRENSYTQDDMIKPF